MLGTYLLTTEGHLRLFRKLAPIFKRRNRRFATLVRSNLKWLRALAVLLLLPLSAIIYFPSMRTPSVLRLVTVAVLFSVVILTTIFATNRYHSIVIMRPSSEPSPLRQELLHKFPLVAISSVLTFLLTLLGLYLKHKYWP